MMLTAKNITITANSELVGSVQGLKVLAKRPVKKIEGAFDNNLVDLVSGAPYYQLSIDRIVMESAGSTDMFQVLHLSEVEVTLQNRQSTVVFSNCQWLSYELNFKKEAPVFENVVLFTGERTKGVN